MHAWFDTLTAAQRDHARRDLTRAGKEGVPPIGLAARGYGMRSTPPAPPGADSPALQAAWRLVTAGALAAVPAALAGARPSLGRRALLGAAMALGIAEHAGAASIPATAEPSTHPHGQHYDLTGHLTIGQLRGFGGVGDGNSHPCGTVIGSLISGYSSMSTAAQLAAIQAYPFPSCQYATSTADEMDLLAIRAAVAMTIAASNGAGGGTVFAEAGIWVCNAPLPPVPPATDVNTGGQQATWSLVGEGSMATVFRFTFDVNSGAGSAFALSCAGRANADGTNYAGTWQGFTLLGPGLSISYGQANCQLSGIGWGARRHMADIHVLGFYQGICAEGDQTLWESVLISNCTFGLFWDLANGILFGDFVVDRVQIVQCSIACVAVSAVTQMAKMLWLKPIFATSPICLAKLVNTNANGWQPNGFFEMEMHGPQFEQYGYAAGAEIDAGTLQPNPNASSYNANLLIDCQLLRAEFGPYDSSRKFPSQPYSCPFFETQNLLGENVITTSIEGNLVPGVNGLWNAIYCGGTGDATNKTTIEGDWTTMLSALRNPPSGFSSYFFANQSVDPEGLVIKTTAWAGRFLYDTTGSSPAIGTYVVNGDANNHMALPAGTPADALAGGGVVMHRHTNGDNGDVFMLVAKAGRVRVNVSGSVAASTVLRTGANGLVAASGPYDQTSLIAGVTVGGSGSAPNGSGMSGTVSTILLNERYDFING